jgi:hypothetical protein
MVQDLPDKKRVETVVVCYTQATFDFNENSVEIEEENEPLFQAHQRGLLAEKLASALKVAKFETDIVKVPLRTFEPRDFSKAAFAWRLLDLSESNGRSIDLAICLDFPAWSLNHRHKVAWLSQLPFFVTRRSSATIIEPSQVPADASVSSNIYALLQAEKRGLFESWRIIAGNRDCAEELARSGMQVEFNPFPPLDLPPDSPAWQKVIARMLNKAT